MWEEADKLYFTEGKAQAFNELVAFDAALQEAGIHEANIINISSVVPQGAELIQTNERILEDKITEGEFCPTVVSKQISSKPDEKIYAAVAGCKFGSGYGINVEAHGTSKDKDSVFTECKKMLRDMADRRGEEIVSDITYRYTSMTVPETGAACVIAAIVYKN